MVVSIGRHGRSDTRDTAGDDATPMGVAVGIGAVAMIVAGVIAALIPVAYPGWRFGVVAVAVLVFAAVSLDHRALAVVAVIGALIFNGFLEDTLGQLSWHGADDLWRLLLLVMVGAFGLAIGEGYRHVRDLRTRYRMADGFALSAVVSRELSAVSRVEEKHGA